MLWSVAHSDFQCHHFPHRR